MRVLLVCAMGMSTSILMKRLRQFAVDEGFDFDVAAMGISSYQDSWERFDCILLGPQMAYKRDCISEAVDIPVGVISARDYGIGNCLVIFSQIHQLLGEAAPAPVA